jgi:poly-gamma-glutamate synthase PgsB/CapB
VRAAALLSLAARDGDLAEPHLLAAATRDVHALPAQVAAEALADLARDGKVRDPRAALAALAMAAQRAELPATARARIGDAMVALWVHTDPIAREAHALLAPEVSRTPIGGSRAVRAPLLATLDEERLARVLAVLADGDHAIGVDRLPDGVVVHRAEPRALAGWRVLHELLHPSPAKRQGFPHTLGRTPPGALRAPPSGLAELTATQVPGERVQSERDGAWGRALPLLDDLLSACTLRASPVTIASAAGRTRIEPPRGLFRRLRARAALTLSYGRFAELRRRALDALEPAAEAAFVREVARVTGVTIRFEPHAFGDPTAPVLAPTPRGLSSSTRSSAATSLATEATEVARAPTATQRASALPKQALPALLPSAVLGLFDALPPAREVGRALVRYTQTPSGSTLPHLAAYAAVVLTAFVVRAAAVRHAIDADRARIPLVIGGWGTRGKSGTERLKAALFQGLGHETLVKTTGCEAMFIHALPGVPAREIFIYRPYDKATVWEQRDLLELARRLRVRVFLWECMALQPDLVSLLQSQWMRDDYSTITNAYPNHEDVQGPSGEDVARVIAEFVPTRGVLLTTEEQMLPHLRAQAHARDTRLRAVRARDAELIAGDLLARFPYQEHPRNVALVAALAQALGVPPAVAIAEMADHVVPDLGVLKTYAKIPWRGRTLSFTNGMSANERTGALGNWQRCGFDRHDPEREPAVRVVTVVNNRADRVARSEVFARFLAEDVSAHAHFVIGTNVGGFLGFLREAVTKVAESLSPVRDLDGDGTDRLRTAHARIDRAFARLKIGRTDAESAAGELHALGLAAFSVATLEALLTPAAPGESYESALASVGQQLGDATVELPHLAALLAGRRAVRALHQLVARDLGGAPEGIDRAFRAAFEAIFFAHVNPIHDASASGDRILDTIAAAMPPGAEVRIMGVQNIKGTGLDLVYRWVSIDAVTRWTEALRSPRLEDREDAARALALHGDYGLLDAELALARLQEARTLDPERARVGYDAAIAHVGAVAAARRVRLHARRAESLGARARGLIGRSLDYLDATRRRRMAAEVLDALVAGRWSHARAARRMREIVARTRGAWMTG